MLHVNDDNFDRILESHDLVVIDFWAEWCAPCRTYGPVFARVAEERTDAVFARCELDSNEELADELGVQAVPTTIVFVGGEPVVGAAGQLDAAELRRLIDEGRNHAVADDAEGDS